MTSVFSTNDAECLSRDTERDVDIMNLDEIWNNQRLNECVSWIKKNQFQKVCLQFPDDVIAFSIKILEDLKNNSIATFCILGDTSYGSCCVDEIAASHVSADAIIHFGHACLSKVARLPAHYVFPNFKLDSAIFSKQLSKMFPTTDENIIIFYSTAFFYQLENLKSTLISYENIQYGHFAMDCKADILGWKVPRTNLEEATCIWIGPDNQSFFNLTIATKVKQWLSYDVNENELKRVASPLATNWMKRRNYCVEKCKDALSIGIVVGTLAADGYLEVVSRIQNLARVRGIRTYLLSVGKINPAKLANFMEIDCFVFVGCPENNIYASRDFYKPLVSVFEAELALNSAWRDQYPNFYSVDFVDILPNGKHHRLAEPSNETNGNDEYDISLVTGRVRTVRTTNVDEHNVTNTENQIERKNNQLMQTNASATFNDRSWTGLNPNLGQDEPAKITKGRTGIAIRYTENEY